jgi:hypothetical protein
MPILKYFVLSILCISIWDATTSFYGLKAEYHVVIAVFIIAYSVGGLMLFRATTISRQFYPWSQLPKRRFYIGLAYRTMYFLIFRTILLFIGISYLTQILYILNPAMIKSPPSPGFFSFLLLTFDNTIPPLAIFMQYIAPSVSSITLDYGNNFSLISRILWYLMMSLVVIAAAKEVWLLVRHSQLDELDRRMKRQAMYSLR